MSKGLRVISYPLIASIRTADSESDFLVYRNFHKEMQDKLFSYFIIPKGAEAKIKAIKNEFLCPLILNRHVYFLQAFIPTEVLLTFDLFTGQYPVDGIITSMAVLAGYLNRLFYLRNLRVTLPVFIIEPKVIDYGDTHNDVSDEELALRSLGYANADLTFFSTPREKEVALKTARRYLSPMFVERVDQKSLVIPLGVDCDEMDEVIKNTIKEEKFTTIFGGRMNSNKRWKTVFDTFGSFYSSGNDLQTWIISPFSGQHDDKTMTDRERVVSASFANIFYNLPRQEYLKKLCSGHVSMNNSIEEGFTVGLIEQLYCGLVVLLPKKEWVKALLLSEYDNYPFLFNDLNEAHSMLKWIYNNYDEARLKIEPIRQFIKKYYKQYDVYNRMFISMREVVDRRWYKPQSKKIRALIDKIILEQAPKFTFDDLIAELYLRMASTARLFNAGVLGYSLTKTELYRHLLEKGCVDTYTTVTPTFTFSGSLINYDKDRND